MNIQAITRAGAAGMIVSGLALGYSYIAHPHYMSPETIAAPFWIVIHALFALSLVLGLLGTIAIYALTAERAGGWGLAGFISLFIGMMLIFGLDYYEVLIAPYLAVHYPQVIADHGAGDAMGLVAVFFPLAGVLTVLGYAALAYGWMKGDVLPKPVAFAMIIAAFAFGFGLSPLGGLMAARVTAAAFGAALIAIGVSAWHSAAFSPAAT
ncbi:hypothetical protein SAMN05444007_11919 [Cribrihabitans marinus]|uniref:Uncharacterized protein n=1 Tax=Cribrihabitans marinus TaxID=1227549 RepID=A0A1H7E0F4_9RHOB|nr:hypothetical protein [Cribrihabitans marinus]GGH41389.1 hypothetical protein GCM10010973_38290 [Cribrihabitans marinus]SEK07476.1 hypothetical protein SAMN05444007_11919 [Cribrihabitans marinus]